jgi:serine/threonine-protein kinase
VGAYRLLQEIGRGGMGAVYRAVRDDDEYRKRVAIKLLRKGMDSEEILRRFRNERQILAGVEHPHIAKLHDGGTAEDGRPYFVMELVEGQPLDAWCDGRRLSVPERLHLFRKVCAAVHYAHQNLIVHRDLKPANVLVTEAGDPKLLDFGIAKLLNPELAGGGADPTRFESRLMTPSYASPEQVRGERITTASDVYSLGVILYELLTGQRPYGLEGASLPEITRAVCEQEPTRPSRVVRRVDGAGGGAGPPGSPSAETLSSRRGSSADKLGRRLSGDLDNIVMMALRKEPHRRYGSVEQLSDDLRRHLEGLPVAARKPTVAYRAGKFVARHRAGTAAAAVAILGLLAFAGAMAVQSARVASERDRAEREARKATAINQFLQETLGSASPYDGLGREVTVVQALREAEKRIADTFASQPEIQAAVKMTVGTTYRALGRYDDAEPLLRSALEIRQRVLGPAHADVAAALNELANLRHDRGEHAGAEALYRQALGLRRQLLGPRHEDVADSLNDLGVLLKDKGDLDGALPLYREALAIRRERLGTEHRLVATSLNNLAVLLKTRGELAEAEALYREAIDIRRKVLGAEHPSVALGLKNLAVLLSERDDKEQAEALYREALAMERRLLGDRHTSVGTTLYNLASLLHHKKDYVAAEPLYREALEIDRATRGIRHASVALTTSALARLVCDRGDHAASARLFAEAVRTYAAALGPDHWRLANSRSAYAACLIRHRRHAEAEALLLAAFPVLRARLGDGHVATRETAERLVELYEAWGRPEKAAAYRPPPSPP